jgi:hypothetical protein
MQNPSRIASGRPERWPVARRTPPDPCLDRSEGLIQLCGHFVVTRLGKKCGFNNPALFRREDLQGISQEAALLLKLADLWWVIRHRRCKWTVHIIGQPFFPMFERLRLNTGTP